MNYPTARAAAMTRLTAATGLTCLLGVPWTVHRPPPVLLWSLSGYERTYTGRGPGHRTRMLYRANLWLLVSLGGNDADEVALEAWIHALPRAFDDDPHLTHLVNEIKITAAFAEGQDGYIEVAENKFRSMRHTVEFQQHQGYGTLAF